LVLVSVYFVFPRTSGDNVWSAKLAEDKAAALVSEVKSKTGSVTQALSPEEADKLKRAVTEGDELWNAAVQGVKDLQVGAKKKYDEAFEKYMAVVNAPQPLTDKTEMARVYGRVIDVAASRKNNQALAKEVAMKSLRQEILPVCNTPESSPVLQAARSALKAEDKELDDWLEKENKKGGGTKNGNKTGSGQIEDRDELVEKIQIGMSRKSVINILGQPDLTMPLGHGQAMLYYLSDTEAFFISIDKNGNVFSADRQERSK